MSDWLTGQPHNDRMEKMRDWFGTPRKSMNTVIWLCFVSLVASIFFAVVTLLVFWVQTIT